MLAHTLATAAEVRKRFLDAARETRSAQDGFIP
jgi:hypothetical protein